jgi:hypothetical protein
MANRDLTKMDAIMAIPLMEFFNYMAMLKTIRKNQAERLSKASKAGFEAYISTLVSEIL